MVRFRTRHLLYLMIAAALVCGYFAIGWERERAIDDAIAILRTADCRYLLGSDGKGSQLSLDLPITFSDGIRKQLKVLPKAQDRIALSSSVHEAPLQAADVELFLPQRLGSFECDDIVFGPEALDQLERTTTAIETVSIDGNLTPEIVSWLATVDSLRELALDSNGTDKLPLGDTFELRFADGFESLVSLYLVLERSDYPPGGITIEKCDQLADITIAIEDRVLNVRVHSNPSLGTLSIHGDGPFGRNTPSKVVLRNCPALRDLTLDGVAFTRELWDEIGKLEHLESLTIRFFREERSEPIELPKNLAQLKSLTISSSVFSAENYAKLEALSTSANVKLDIYDLEVVDPVEEP